MGWLRPTMFLFMIVCWLSPGVGGKCLLVSLIIFTFFAKFSSKQFCRSVQYKGLKAMDMVMWWLCDDMGDINKE